jgi:uncharacterized protein (TIGR02246 family)
MKQFSALCSMTVIALMAIACNQPADTHDADATAIRNNEAQWNQDWAAKDAAKVAAYYADDAVVMAPGTPAATGKEAITGELKQMLADPALSLQFKTARVEVAKSGDLAVTQGSYVLAMTDPQSKQVIHDHGSYVTTWRKQADGSWKAVEDIASSEVPPPAPPTAPAMMKKKG